MFVLRPARNFKVDRADEIIFFVEIDLDLLLAECVLPETPPDSTSSESHRGYSAVMKDTIIPSLTSCSTFLRQRG